MGEYFLVNKEDTIVRLNKGITEARVNELLGDKYKTEPGKDLGEERRVYHFNNKVVTDKNQYKLLIRWGVLEWIMQISR